MMPLAGRVSGSVSTTASGRLLEAALKSSRWTVARFWEHEELAAIVRKMRETYTAADAKF